VSLARCHLPLRLESLNKRYRVSKAEQIRTTQVERGLARAALHYRQDEIRGALARSGLVVVLTRIGPGKLDPVNLFGALKAVQDGVADVVGVPDNDPRVDWRFDQRRGMSRPRPLPADYGVLVEVDEARP
jgi:hypothetical protein